MKRTSVACTAILLLATSAWGEAIYKYRMPDGRILYTQAPQKQGRLLKVMQVQRPEARQTALAAQRVEQEKARADELAAQRRETEAAQNDLRLATLAHAETALQMQTQYAPEPGVVIYPGYGGYPRDFESGGGSHWYRWGKAPSRSHHWGGGGGWQPRIGTFVASHRLSGFSRQAQGGTVAVLAGRAYLAYATVRRASNTPHDSPSDDAVSHLHLHAIHAHQWCARKLCRPVGRGFHQRRKQPWIG